MPSGAPATKSRNRLFYEAHVNNVRALEKAITVAERMVKTAVKDGRDDEATVGLLLLYTLNGIWCENLLRKTVFTRGVMSDAARAEIFRDRSGYATKQRDRWISLVDAVLFSRYNVTKVSRLRPYAQRWRKRLKDDVERNVIPVIDDRNDLAHGGWAMDLAGDTPTLAPANKTDDYLTLRKRRAAVREIADLLLRIHVMRRSREADLKESVLVRLDVIDRLDVEIHAHDPGLVVEVLRRRKRL